MEISSSPDELRLHGRYFSVPVGNSMKPLFHHKENIVEIIRAVHPLEKYDLSLHIRKDGKTVLHRILKVKDGHYVIGGDNCINTEIVQFDQVLGKGVRFYHHGKWVPVTDYRYQLYVRIWIGLLPLRRIVNYIIRVISKCGIFSGDL